MEVGGIMPSAVAGLERATAQINQAGQEVASGNLDPAVLVQLTTAHVQFAASAKMVQMSGDMSRHLLDMVA